MKAPARQRGAALLVVLSLVAIASVVAMAGVKSALVDERLVGNMRAMAQAQMAADWGGAERLSETPESSGLLECAEIQDRAEQGGVSADWSDVHTLTNSDTVGYRHIDCIEQDVVVQLIMGQVSDGEQVLARHFLMVGREKESSGLELPDLIPDDCMVYAGGPVVAHPELDQPANCQLNGLAHPGNDYGPDSYIDEVAKDFEDADFGPDGCASHQGIVYCDARTHGFDGSLNLADYPDADQIVIVVDPADPSQSVTIEAPAGSYDTSIVVSGAPTLAPHGQVELNGDIWSTGSMAISGGGGLTINGRLVAEGPVTINGKVEISPDEGGEGDGGVIWIDRDD
ncbi:hypothetical protein [Halomonas sp. DN3]|uniref:hypothetical protein n=1 Tax=Halomonas sp. DN3 TaxID=2953657 RepID=UPI0020A1C004|nr:hypothetical protein [Halomonas sp. DN3]USZ49329.1 hypothetical protein NKF27_17840 [Halomonas sp. DN3]